MAWELHFQSFLMVYKVNLNKINGGKYEHNSR